MPNRFETTGDPVFDEFSRELAETADFDAEIEYQRNRVQETGFLREVEAALLADQRRRALILQSPTCQEISSLYFGVSENPEAAVIIDIFSRDIRNSNRG